VLRTGTLTRPGRPARRGESAGALVIGRSAANLSRTGRAREICCSGTFVDIARRPGPCDRSRHECRPTAGVPTTSSSGGHERHARDVPRHGRRVDHVLVRRTGPSTTKPRSGAGFREWAILGSNRWRRHTPGALGSPDVFSGALGCAGCYRFGVTVGVTSRSNAATHASRPRVFVVRRSRSSNEVTMAAGLVLFAAAERSSNDGLSPAVLIVISASRSRRRPASTRTSW
jgi:hypothetical protein